MEAQLGTPLGKCHAEIAAEESGQGAVACPDVTTQLGKRAAVGWIDAQNVANLEQQRHFGRGQVQCLLGRGPQLVEQHGTQAGSFRAVVLLITGVSNDQLAQQRAYGQHRGRVQSQRIHRHRQPHQVQLQLAVGLMGVHGAGRHPNGPGSRGDPGARVGGHCQHPTPCVDDLVIIVPVGVDRRARSHGLSAGRCNRHVADFRHHVAAYRKCDTAIVADHDKVRRRTPITLLSIGHACVDIYQGAVASLVPFFVAERAYSYAAVSGIVLAASLLSSVAQPVFGALTDRWAMPWLLPVSTLLGGAGIALSGVTGSYPLTLVFVAVSGIGVAAYHPESARVARLASQGSHSAMSWFSLGGNLGFAVAPLMVAAVVTIGGLRLTPLLLLPALAGAVLCLPVLRALERQRSSGTNTTVPPRDDDRASFVKLSLAVVCRSIVFIGLSTFISLYAAERMNGSTAAGTAALFVLYLGGAVGSVLGGTLANRWGRVTVARWSYLLTVGSVASLIFIPGPALYLFVALTSAGLYVPFSLQLTLGQDYLPSRVGTASGITLGLTVSIGGLVSPLIGSVADATSLQTALAPLVLMPALSWFLFRTLPEPTLPPFTNPLPPGVELEAAQSHGASASNTMRTQHAASASGSRHVSRVNSELRPEQQLRSAPEPR